VSTCQSHTPTKPPPPPQTQTWTQTWRISLQTITLLLDLTKKMIIWAWSPLTLRPTNILRYLRQHPSRSSLAEVGLGIHMLLPLIEIVSLQDLSPLHLEMMPLRQIVEYQNRAFQLQIRSSQLHQFCPGCLS
jgi:hypothetical protein